MSKCHKSDQSGLKSSARPIYAPGRVKENMTIRPITTNSIGTNIWQTLPKPSSKFLWDISQIINHPTNIEMAIVGIKLWIPINESVDCNKFVLKKVFGSAPHPLKKLNIK